ncbi:MAG TPA: hypothetical protein VFO62_10715 [Candidatus Binatia bacterium]|nr:hypothetical protein [Candidatus Binatia bacterium]
MKVDIKAILGNAVKARTEAVATHEEQRVRRIENLEFWRRLPVAHALEGRVLVAMLCDSAVLALCEDVESDDFAHSRHRVVFNALRNMQALGLWSTWTVYEAVYHLGERLALEDEQLDKHVRDHVDDIYLGELIAKHMYETYGEVGAPDAAWLAHDCAKLRELAEKRRAL